MSGGASEEPRNLVERAAAAAFDAVDRTLADAGASVGTLYLALKALDVPAGELDCVSAAHGSELAEGIDERSRDVVAFLVSEAAQTARQVGLSVHVVPIAKRGLG